MTTSRRTPVTVTCARLFGVGALVVIAPHAAAMAPFVGFESATSVAVGDAPISLAVGDLNGDGIVDLAVTNTQQGAVSIRFGVGDGQFMAASELSVGAFPDGIAIGDVDGDNDLDLVVTTNPAGAKSDGVVVLNNNGVGMFTLNGLHIVGSSPKSVELVDLDRDTHLDLVVGVFNGVAVMNGDGEGGFSAPEYVPAGSSFVFAKVADIDRDGNVDVVAAGFSSATISVLLNQGAGLLETPIAYPSGDRPRSFAIGDINLDGWPDVVVAGATTDGVGSVHMLHGNGAGGFNPPKRLISDQDAGAGVGPWDVCLVDLDFDTDLDLVVSNESSGNIGVHLNNNDGTFARPRYYAAGASARAIATSDFNRDGSADLVVATLAADSVAVLLNLTRNPLDLNSNGLVDSVDLAILLSTWGTDGGPLGADLNGDGIVNGADLAILLSGWSF